MEPPTPFDDIASMEHPIDPRDHVRCPGLMSFRLSNLVSRTLKKTCDSAAAPGSNGSCMRSHKVRTTVAASGATGTIASPTGGGGISPQAVTK
eukprot:3376526-Pyramimonas_sp.AAC.1